MLLTLLTGFELAETKLPGYNMHLKIPPPILQGKKIPTELVCSNENIGEASCYSEFYLKPVF